MSVNMTTSTLRRPEITMMWFAVTALFIICGAELVAILRLNNGHLVYSLDDAAIHLALAENIARGHYGVNLGEFSSPSSSILWPFLLAPFAGSRVGEYAPLVFDLLAAVGTMIVFVRVLARPFRGFEQP